MDQKQIVKQMMEFNKTAFDNTFNAMIGMQDQAEKMVSSFLKNLSWLPEDGKKAINDWVNTYKQSREDFKAAVDEGYKKVADFFADTPKEEAAKAGKK
jgi:hypothetical protein